MIGFDLRHAFGLFQFVQTFALIPGEALARGCIGLLELFGFLEEIGMPFAQSNPLVALLKKTEIAARTRAPFIVFGQSQTRIIQDAANIFFP